MPLLPSVCGTAGLASRIHFGSNVNESATTLHCGRPVGWSEAFGHRHAPLHLVSWVRRLGLSPLDRKTVAVVRLQRFCVRSRPMIGHVGTSPPLVRTVCFSSPIMTQDPVLPCELMSRGVLSSGKPGWHEQHQCKFGCEGTQTYAYVS